MRRFLAIFSLFTFALSACLNTDPVTAAPPRQNVTPSRTPNILLPTLTLAYPTATVTPTTPATNTPSPPPVSGPSPTATLTSTPTETFPPSPTNSLPPPSLTIQLMGCNTGLDVTHGMGEVTNAYLTLSNASGLDLTTVCATLSAPDEGRVHPDKTTCIPSLPTGYQLTLKLTIDTTFRVDTLVRVDVTSSEGISASLSETACTDIGPFPPAPETIGILQPIP